MSPTNAILQCRSIGVHIGPLTVLDGVSLDVAAESVHALIGPNGAGKTTLANVITGHHRKYSGSVLLRGAHLAASPWQRARAGLGRKFQQPQVFPRATAADNLVIADKRQPKVHHSVDHALASALSHGAQQRLEWEMVASKSPAVMILDEPTAGLAIDERRELAARVCEFRETAGVTFLIVEHDLQFVSEVADEVSFLESGRLLLTGSYETVRANSTVRETYLGSYA